MEGRSDFAADDLPQDRSDHEQHQGQQDERDPPVLPERLSAGVDAGGESLGENGGVAFILLTVMLLVAGAILWWIIGRED